MDQHDDYADNDVPPHWLPTAVSIVLTVLTIVAGSGLIVFLMWTILLPWTT